MATIRETRIPGLGVRFEFVTAGGQQVGVLHHRQGDRRELLLYDPRDPDTVASSIRLDDDDARSLAEILGSSRVVEDLGKLRQEVEGLAIDWLPVPADTPFAGRTIGDTGARTRTGTSIVAVMRDERAIPAPGPDQGLEAEDVLVVVGTPRGIEELAVILRTG